MLLIIDLGNTRIKAAVIEQDAMRRLEIFPADEAREKLSVLLKNFSIDAVVTSATGHDSVDFLLEMGLKVHRVSHDWKLPFINDYHTPHTLGTDRMVLAAGATLAYPSTNRLVIDAGTCVTYDFVDADGHYKGGAISPGLRMRYRAMNAFTARLPELDPEWPEGFIGRSTAESMHSGAAVGLALEIDGFISRYLEQSPNFIIILTGGDAEFLADRLKNRIFASPDFLMESLNKLYQYQSRND